MKPAPSKPAVSYHLKIPLDVAAQVKKFAHHDERTFSSAILYVIRRGLETLNGK